MRAEKIFFVLNQDIEQKLKKDGTEMQVQSKICFATFEVKQIQQRLYNEIYTHEMSYGLDECGNDGEDEGDDFFCFFFLTTTNLKVR